MLFNRFKIFIFLLVAGFLFLTTAAPALAQWDAYNKAMQSVGLKSDPAKDPLCWQAKVCYATLTEMKQTPKTDSWQSPGPNNRCGSGLGVCLPAGTTDLEIKIGQTSNIKDLGDYIKTIYVYLLGIGGIVAAVLLIKSGADWMMGGVSAEGIKNAQATIMAALTGLLLLLGSYVLLYTISPDLVNLKLPQVYMVRPAESDMAEGGFCRTEGPLMATCASLGKPGEYNCRPFLTKGPMAYFTDAVGVTIFSFLIPVPGEAAATAFLGNLGTMLSASLAKAGIWTAKTTGKAVGKYAGAAFGAPLKKIIGAWAKTSSKVTQEVYGAEGGLVAVETLTKSSSEMLNSFGQAVATTLKEGKILGWNSLKTAGVTGGTGIGVYYLSGEVYELLKGNEPGLPGTCEQSLKLGKGEFCNTKSNPSDCAAGKCMKVGDFGGWVTGADLGVCSSGGPGGLCNAPADCGAGSFKCIENICSDGSFNLPCESNSDCQSGLKCLIFLSEYRCLKAGGASKGESCMITAKSGEDGSCQDSFDCIKAPVVGSGPQGICTDHKVNSPCFKDEQCAASGQNSVVCFGIILAMPDLAKPGTCTLKP